MKQIRKRLTYANVMSSIAVFLILGGATAFAAVKKIGANQIKANSIKTGKIVKEAVTAGKIKNGAVTETKIADGAVMTNKLADNAVTTNKIANDAVTGDKVKESSLGEVPSANKATLATTASNANALAGLPGSAYQPRTQWASVKSDGTILQQSGGITMLSHNVNGGNYLDFGQSIVGKSIITSPRYLDPGIGSNGANVTAQPCSGPLTTFPCLFSGTLNNPNVVFVLTSDFEGTGEPYGFSILVTP